MERFRSLRPINFEVSSLPQRGRQSQSLFRPGSSVLSDGRIPDFFTFLPLVLALSGGSKTLWTFCPSFFQRRQIDHPLPLPPRYAAQLVRGRRLSSIRVIPAPKLPFVLLFYFTKTSSLFGPPPFSLLTIESGVFFFCLFHNGRGRCASPSRQGIPARHGRPSHRGPFLYRKIRSRRSPFLPQNPPSFDFLPGIKVRDVFATADISIAFSGAESGPAPFYNMAASFLFHHDSSPPSLLVPFNLASTRSMNVTPHPGTTSPPPFGMLVRTTSGFPLSFPSFRSKSQVPRWFDGYQ